VAEANSCHSQRSQPTVHPGKRANDPHPPC
jgi:hypothetical protein